MIATVTNNAANDKINRQQKIGAVSQLKPHAVDQIFILRLSLLALIAGDGECASGHIINIYCSILYYDVSWVLARTDAIRSGSARLLGTFYW